MWVRSKYTSELAVLSAWIALFIPWNISRHSQHWDGAGVESSIFFVQFPLFEIQIRSGSVFEEANGQVIEFDISNFEANQYAGTELFGNYFLSTPPQSVAFYDGLLLYANVTWTVGAIAIGSAFLLSLALYFREGRVTETLPVSDVRLMGALLGVGTLATAVAAVCNFLERDVVGTPIPVGVLVLGALSFVLLTAEQIPDEPFETEEPDDTSNADDAE